MFRMISRAPLALLPIVLGMIAIASPALSDTWHVPGDAPTIQAGIDSASAGDVVLIECGTYYEYDIVLKSGVDVMASSPCVTIDAEEQGRVFYGEKLDVTTHIQNLTITGGHVTGGIAYGDGGGMYLDQSGPEILNCVFEGNSAEHNGGGLFLSFSNPTIEGCRFIGNESESIGGGLDCFNSSPTVLSSWFIDNDGGNFGGAVDLRASSPTFAYCVLANNTAQFRGGGLRSFNSHPNLQNCTFYGNGAEDGGAVNLTDDSSVTITQCILSFSTEGVAVFDDGTTSLTMTCSVVWENAGGDWVSGLEGMFGVDGNFGADPGFCDAAAQDFFVCSDSWVLPLFHNWCGLAGLIGALDAGCGDCSPQPTTRESWGGVKARYR